MIDNSWTKPKHPVTTVEIEEVYKILDEFIKSSGGIWEGSVKDVFAKTSHANDKLDEWYGVYWNAIMKVRNTYGICYEKRGSRGGRYWYGDHKVMDMKLGTQSMKDKEKVNQVRVLVNSINPDGLDAGDMKEILRVIARIVS